MWQELSKKKYGQEVKGAKVVGGFNARRECFIAMTMTREGRRRAFNMNKDTRI
jgi:hypothetical protein